MKSDPLISVITCGLVSEWFPKFHFITYNSRWGSGGLWAVVWGDESELCNTSPETWPLRLVISVVVGRGEELP